MWNFGIIFEVGVLRHSVNSVKAVAYDVKDVY